MSIESQFSSDGVNFSNLETWNSCVIVLGMFRFFWDLVGNSYGRQNVTIG